MTDEEKKAIADAEAEAKKANEESNQDESQDNDESKEEKVDYEALLNKEKERNKILQDEIADKAFKLREAKRVKDEGTADDLEDEDKPLTKKELQTILASEREATLKQVHESKALEIARTYTSSEIEAQAAVEYYRNRVRSTGNLEDDILFAVGGLNSKKIIATNKELKRALQSRGNASNDASGTHRESSPAGESKLSPQDAQAFKQAGFVWDGTKRLYKKTLNGGKTILYKDPKTKKTWVE